MLDEYRTGQATGGGLGVVHLVNQALPEVASTPRVLGAEHGTGEVHGMDGVP